MSNYITNPITGIKVPTPGSDPGPEYAQFVSNALNTLSALTHTGVSNLDGYQIPAAGLNINADVSFQSHNATSLRTTRYTEQLTVPSGVGDVGCVYFLGGDLWINNGSGTPVQITAGGAVDVTVSNTYPAKSLSSNYVINPSDGYIIFEVNTTAARIITLPLANSVANGRFLIIKDSTGTANTHNITINPAGSDLIDGQGSYVINTNYGVVELIGDGNAKWQVFRGAQTEYDSGESLTFGSGSALNLLSGATETISSGGTVHFNTGSHLDGYFTGNVELNAGHLNTSSTGVININNNSGFVCNTVGGMQLTNSDALNANAAHAIQVIHSGGIYTNGGVGSIELGGTSADIGFGVNTQSITRVIPPQSLGLPSNWSPYAAGPYPAIYVPTTTSNQQVIIPLNYLLNGQTLNTVKVLISVGGSHSSLPQHLPAVDVRCVNLTATSVPGADFSLNTGAPISPNPADATAWNATKSWTFTCNQANLIDRTQYSYYILLTDEYGTNSLAGNVYFGFILNYTVTDMQII